MYATAVELNDRYNNEEYCCKAPGPMLIIKGEVTYSASVSAGRMQLKFPLGNDEHVMQGKSPKQLVLLLLQLTPEQTRKL